MDIQLDSKTIERLSAIAALKAISPEELAAQMLEQETQREARFEREKADDIATLTDMENGQYVENGEVMEWLDSWGTDNELPCPAPTK